MFLTTQYLEEADELADRVGIINAGRIVAEGTPSELKRAIGTDVVTVVVDGDADAAKSVLEGIAGIEGVDVFGGEVRVGTENGSQALSPVAIALGVPASRCASSAFVHRPSTMSSSMSPARTSMPDPRPKEFDMTTASTAARTEIRPRRTGFVHDTVSIARRAIRQLPRDIALIGPTLFIPLFFLVINVASLSEAAAFVDLGITYEEFQLPVAIVFAVTGVTRAGAMVLDIQNGYFDRLMTTPVSRRRCCLATWWRTSCWWSP